MFFNFCLTGVLLYDALGWEVRMPKEIHGLRGSCLVIPCSFSYTSYPPKDPRRVVWYQWVSRGYPLVYDPLHANDVIDKFKGKTQLYRKSGDCSLLITRLEQSHSGEKIYAWIDPENVGWRTYAFYDVTATVLVDASPQQPSISMYGGEKMGDAITVECSTFHTCPYSKPTITLNGIAGSDKIKDESIKDGLLKITLTRTEYNKPVQILNETHFQYMADVIPKITALPRSCVVIPCSFKMEKYVARLRVLWVTEGGGYMFHTDPVDVLDNFKGRTRLLGNPDEQNCTVEMDNVQTNDNGSFCFRAEKGNEKYSFYNSCVFIIMQASPDKPVMSSLPEDIEPRTPIAIKCSVNHTCSSHPPQITWSVPTSQESISHSHMGGGVWETVSAVTFIPTGYEERDEIVCTANFWGGRTQENTAFLNIRRVQGLRLETIGSSIIAPTLVFILICVLAGVFIYKMRHSKDAKVKLYLTFTPLLLIADSFIQICKDHNRNLNGGGQFGTDSKSRWGFLY
ncbi:hypothetical protein cypCar_00038829 [Cyprinus carpio]|nr:hypothetical protein cypCar_00038829 [Cyprinus carpio]